MEERKAAKIAKREAKERSIAAGLEQANAGTTESGVNPTHEPLVSNPAEPSLASQADLVPRAKHLRIEATAAAAGKDVTQVWPEELAGKVVTLPAVTLTAGRRPQKAARCATRRTDARAIKAAMAGSVAGGEAAPAWDVPAEGNAEGLGERWSSTGAVSEQQAERSLRPGKRKAPDGDPSASAPAAPVQFNDAATEPVNAPDTNADQTAVQTNGDAVDSAICSTPAGTANGAAVTADAIEIKDYKEWFAHKYGVTNLNELTPLMQVKGFSLRSSAINYLMPMSQASRQREMKRMSQHRAIAQTLYLAGRCKETGKGAAEVAAEERDAADLAVLSWKGPKLVPELCSVHPLRLSVWRSLQYLPSLMYRLEVRATQCRLSSSSCRSLKLKAVQVVQGRQG
jgi:hypothetical protein